MPRFVFREAQVAAFVDGNRRRDARNQRLLRRIESSAYMGTPSGSQCFPLRSQGGPSVEIFVKLKLAPGQHEGKPVRSDGVAQRAGAEIACA